ncbi:MULTISPECIES: FMN-binding negative transcriptional regulator [Rhizobium]|uniref:FMN-binding negative transcriptional regulator n=1 Tax=Rhizobium rhododendri TaxID=2506430 RepID=A0ABY8IEX1_9HYPH|nr:MULTISPECIES: FMN-binding negative transcriptional regulator [Rhizobium]MBZ5762688.1 FMN-binding negative transcriptional regulator [Rhizobium sp. VS19-DR96]MBZ5768628.1 FMN-binding negative transcriptional regulator [Rhizobium sp. VS19-DR129.2]MBZ5776142.1 FMN-binding negative transcriptional regulator [Rhizobium sp. VS19-DRK62.2]MBZ5787418.1 FMN-binding negative transcriptional regulator [Rhizobium sp. VS19-DR121]MBZ5804706.1 FMN-binding negative transcriptional regulator [Rhizobium sp. V
MYQPPHFREDRIDIQHGLIRAHPLGLLISSGADGPVANPIPFHLDPSFGSKGRLQAHVARANGQWREIRDGAPVLVVFQGPHAYITPSWYRTKLETGKVVPTWNYAIVQVRGPARVIEDGAWIRAQVEALTRDQEGPRAEPWAVGDAPDTYIASQIKGIVGIEIDIAEIDGKWKVSQNRSEADRNGVAQGLMAEPDVANDAEAMAAMVNERGKP